MCNFLSASLVIILLASLGCSNQANQGFTEQTSPLQYSKSYKASVFKDIDRIQKIGEALAGSHHIYAETARVNHLPGLAYGLVVDDSLVFFGGYGTINTESWVAVSEHSLFRIASMTKSFTAMAILKLRDQGKLSLSDPVSMHIPQLKKLGYLSSDVTPVSIWNLLTMTAGFPEDNPWGDRFLDMSDEALLMQVEKGISFSTHPSLHYEYSNLGFGLLGHIISTVSGLPYQEYISKNILLPLGMTHTYWEFSKVAGELLARGYRWEDEQWIPENLLHDGAFGAMGGLITSIEDFSKYVSFHLSAWPPRSDTPDDGPLKRSSIREMQRMNNPRFYSDPMRFNEHSGPIMRGYGYGLVAMKDQQGVVEVGHNGGLPGFGSSYMFYPEYGIGIMAFSNLTYVGGTVRSANYRIMKELISQGLFHPRDLPVSEVLEKRAVQVAELIQNWDPELEQEIVAANLYMDISREKRMQEAEGLLLLAGKILSVGAVIPENQLRGSFIIEGSNRDLKVYFTLTPEAEPRVQWITLELVNGE
jgi:CubicO group peptidase (beta-lactamase class C family)